MVTRGVLAREGGPALTDKPRTTRLRDDPFTRDLNSLPLETLAGRSRGCTYSVAEYLWRQGARTEFFFLICSGQVALEIAILHEGALQIEKVGRGSFWAGTGCSCPADGMGTRGRGRRCTRCGWKGKFPRQKCEQDSLLRQNRQENLAVVTAQRLLARQARFIQAMS